MSAEISCRSAAVRIQIGSVAPEELRTVRADEREFEMGGSGMVGTVDYQSPLIADNPWHLRGA